MSATSTTSAGIGVTAAAGFRAAGIAAGIKSSGAPDLALVVNDGPSRAAAAVFTGNRVRAAPVHWTEQVVKGGRLHATVLNSGGANACTGPLGFQDTHATAERLAEVLGTSAAEVAVCSTGLIGVRLPMEQLLKGLSVVAGALSDQGGADAAEAIRTTDTVAKTAVVTRDGYTVGGMAKGAGMLAPGLATMLSVLTTDASVPSDVLDRVLRSATARSFDRIDSDGCMSTNDTVILMASGASGVVPDPDGFAEAVTEVCNQLSRQLIADAEGATKEIEIQVVRAATEADGLEAARSIARNNLFKCAMYGEDPNWGRVLSAVGTTSAAFDPDRLAVAINGIWVCRDGAAGEDRELCDLSGRRIRVTVDLDAGAESVTVWTNDLSNEYVHENSAYSFVKTIAGGTRFTEALAKANVLTQALPWLSRFHRATVVVKFGGHAMVDEDLKRAFAQDIVFLRYAGLRPVVVHGGGPQINKQLELSGLTPQFAGGLRVTTPEAMDVVRMVLTGQVQRDIVGLINQHGPFAVGMSGEDADTLRAVRRTAMVDGQEVDLGRVGDIDRVDPTVINALLDDGRIPVVSSIARADDGGVYNVNADTAAAALAVGLAAEKLVVLTDVEGVYANWDEVQAVRAATQTSAVEDLGLQLEVISQLSTEELERLLPTLGSGMAPKMEACLRAVRAGVHAAHVLDGRVQHALLLEVFTDEGIGTMVTANGSTATTRERA